MIKLTQKIRRLTAQDLLKFNLTNTPRNFNRLLAEILKIFKLKPYSSLNVLFKKLNL